MKTVTPKGRRGNLKAQERRTGFLFLLPALVAFSAVILYPFIQSLRLSLYKYTIDMERPAFVGLANFSRLLADPGTATVWLNTLVFVVLTTGLMATGFPMVAPRRPAESYLVQTLLRDPDGTALYGVLGEPMPPEEPLAHPEMVAIVRWIEAGALP